MRPINEEEILKGIEELKESPWFHSEIAQTGNMAEIIRKDCMEVIVSLCIEKIKTIESDKWIPVEERLPEECGYYLCTVKWDEKDRSAVLYFSKIENEWMEENECGFFEGLNQECISAWKNQEEPYKPEGEKE